MYITNTASVPAGITLEVIYFLYPKVMILLVRTLCFI